jgi:hypothetical protein
MAGGGGDVEQERQLLQATLGILEKEQGPQARILPGQFEEATEEAKARSGGEERDRWLDFERVDDTASLYDSPAEALEVMAENNNRVRMMLAVESAPGDEVGAQISRLDNTSVNFSFSGGKGTGEWRDGRISIGPSEPAEPFVEKVEEMFADPHGRVVFTSTPTSTMYRETHYPTRRYKVQTIVSEGEASFDELTELTKDRLRDAERIGAQSDIELTDLSVERRPGGTLWVWGIFDVVDSR